MSSQRHERELVAAAQEALRDSGLLDDARVDRTRFGVYLGSGEGSSFFGADMNGSMMSGSFGETPVEFRFRI